MRDFWKTPSWARKGAALAAIGWAFFGGGFARPAGAQTVNLEARLILASNNPQAARAKKLDMDSVRRFFRVYKWTNFFLVRRERFTVAPGAARRVTMASNCVAVVRNLGEGRLECKLYQDGNLAGSETGALAPAGRIIIGGDSRDRDAWFLSLRYPKEDRVEKPVSCPAILAGPVPGASAWEFAARPR